MVKRVTDRQVAEYLEAFFARPMYSQHRSPIWRVLMNTKRWKKAARGKNIRLVMLSKQSED